MFFLKINDVIQEFIFDTKRSVIIYIVELLEREGVDNPVTVLKNAPKTLIDREDTIVTPDATYIIFEMDRHVNCCVCKEPIRKRDQLECGHPICIECLKRLRKNECPVCRQQLVGKIVTDEILVMILTNEEGDRCEHEHHQQTLAMLSMYGVNINEIYS